MTYVFVYGTLRKGFGNNELLENSRFVGYGRLRNKDMYYVYSRAGFPCIIDGKGIVKGEIYDVDETVLNRLDMLEGYNEKREHSMYLRKKDVAVLDDNTEIEVEYYHWNYEVNDRLKIEGGDYAKSVKSVKKLHKFWCPVCNHEIITDDYYLYWDFQTECKECKKINYFEGGDEIENI